MRALLVLVGLAVPVLAGAQSRGRNRARAAPVRVTVMRAASSSPRQARAAAQAFGPRVARCVATAQATDPAGLAAAPAAGAVVHLGAGGRAAAVELTPSTLARGLSACLATELLGWQQSGHVGQRAAVHLALDLRP